MILLMHFHYKKDLKDSHLLSNKRNLKKKYLLFLYILILVEEIMKLISLKEENIDQKRKLNINPKK